MPGGVEVEGLKGMFELMDLVSLDVSHQIR